MNKRVALVFVTTAGKVQDSFPVGEHLYAIKRRVMEQVGTRSS